MQKLEYEDSIRAYNGQQLFCRHLKPAGGELEKAKAIVFVNHGFAEHVGRCEEIFRHFHDRGFYVFGHDHVGHGQSSGQRAHVTSFDDFSIPVQLHIEETLNNLENKEKQPKLFVYGHSMGGQIALKALPKIQHHAAGVILEAPFLGMQDNIPKWLISATVSMGRNVLTSSLPVSKIKAKHLTHDETIVKNYEADPLIFHGSITASFLASSVQAVNDIFESAPLINVPMFIGHGDADKICPISASRRYFEVVGSTSYNALTYLDSGHFLAIIAMNDDDDEDVEDGNFVQPIFRQC